MSSMAQHKRALSSGEVPSVKRPNTQVDEPLPNAGLLPSFIYVCCSHDILRKRFTALGAYTTAQEANKTLEVLRLDEKNPEEWSKCQDSHELWSFEAKDGRGRSVSKLSVQKVALNVEAPPLPESGEDEISGQSESLGISERSSHEDEDENEEEDTGLEDWEISYAKKIRAQGGRPENCGGNSCGFRRCKSCWMQPGEDWPSWIKSNLVQCEPHNTGQL